MKSDVFDIRFDIRPGRHKSPANCLTSLGVCLGASTVSVVQLTRENIVSQSERLPADKPRIIGAALHTHDGNPKQTLIDVLARLDLDKFDRIAATGRQFRRFLHLSSIPEPQAVERAYPFVKPTGVRCPAILSAGGETFMVYVLNRAGRIANVITGNKCASGTGEFFLQQLRRMNVSLEEAARFSAVEIPHRVSGRCSVFCKSDCTHATNKGIPKSKVTAGLCRMMADKTLELLKNVDRRHIMVVGGTARNAMMLEYLRREIEALVVPEEAPYFEALGAALWALDHETVAFPGFEGLFKHEATSFDRLAPLKKSVGKVTFKTMAAGTAKTGDECILGLDVGSTTTKAVLMRIGDNAMLASVYLRTNGDPVGASRRCYAAIRQKIASSVGEQSIHILGLGVCGSGRQIAGLHALTDGVINEIIAHAAASVYFDPAVDTIFEIGGQDAKYTHIVNGVPSDYAMNEACSAGTGSFLEESALETLGLKMTDIADVALKGVSPPNFNDQCAAFIASDIKNAIHEGIAHQDIVAGLVYSICMNYTNRVKGNRPVGEKIFMQGGVCYNRAVPLAMAALVGKPIIVPPEPGLMGAFGVALEVKNRLAAGLLARRSFDLTRLIEREVIYKNTFTCKGSREKCDRRCEIARIELDGKLVPFGGACNRWENLRRNVRHDVAGLDLVRRRQELVFKKYAPQKTLEGSSANRPAVAINRSFLVNTYYPLYATFFDRLGFTPVLPAIPSQEGINRHTAPFCYPGELTHGFFHSLVTADPAPDYIFLPHFKAVPAADSNPNAQVCPLVQGETFYLQTTFKAEIKALAERGTKVLAPLIDLTGGLANAENQLVETARAMNIGRRKARAAFAHALGSQQQCLAEIKNIGKRALNALEADPSQIGVVIFGRPYNAFTEEAHMGIPHKFASRGIRVIPLDFLPFEGETSKRHMYWGMGQQILMAGRWVERHPQLFGVFITNFSCGPDSFIISYFRSLMGQKPSLTLELDSHSADAGIETRIEAFLDIVAAYNRLTKRSSVRIVRSRFRPARTVFDNGTPKVVTSNGERLPLTDPRVTLLLPSMGEIGSQAMAAAFRGVGFNGKAPQPADESILKLGRGHTTCKECLPLILTTGTLLSYIRNEKQPGEVLTYFLATGSGPCRFGQYYIFMEDLIKRLRIPDVALLSLTGENSYLGMQKDFEKRAWWAVVIADVMEDARSMLLANAAHTTAAMSVFEGLWAALLEGLESDDFPRLENRLALTARHLRQIQLKRPPKTVPTIALTGEIFVRRDALSRQHLTEQLAAKGFATICSPVAEWIHYTNYMVEHGYGDNSLGPVKRLRLKIRNRFMVLWERRIKTILGASGLVNNDPVDIKSTIAHAAPYISKDLPGEAVLTVGGSLAEVAEQACGVIAIGPFGCMPNRLSEAILTETMTRECKLAADPENKMLKTCLTNIDDLPFLAIESDGSPFPQLITAKLEAFCLRAERLHRQMAAGTPEA